jgi:hypothetical protein
MIFESKWLIIGCALALIVGIALVSPLLTFHTVINPFPVNPQVYPNPQSSQSQIAINLKNIHLALGNMTLPKNMTTIHSTPTATNMVTYPTFSGIIYINETKYLNDNQKIPDAEVDCFSLQILTENGTLIASESAYVGTAYNRSYALDQSIDGEFMYKTFGILNAGGQFERAWSIGTTIEFNRGFSGTINQSIAFQIESSQTLIVTLSRISTIVARGNSTMVSTSDAGLIETVTLTKQGDSFFYNPDGSSKPIPLSITEPIF